MRKIFDRLKGRPDTAPADPAPRSASPADEHSPNAKAPANSTPSTSHAAHAPRPASSKPHPSSGPARARTPATVDGAFKDLGLIEPLCRAVHEEGYATPTPIQTQAVPYVLQGRDLLGCAQTGTGKTAAFALPILQRLSETRPETRGIRTLILTPTRELAIQIGESFTTYGRHLRLHSTVVFGGVGAEPQKQALKRHPDILVATPGRLLDLMGQGFVDLKNLSIFVLDEADRMLDMGFIHDVKRVIAVLPRQRQSLLFSATMPPDIQELAMSVLKNPAKVEVAPVSSTSEQVTQRLYYVDRNNKRPLLLHVLEDRETTRVILFTRTKAIANRVAEFLCKSDVKAEAIHGNKSQSARQRALENFRRGTTRVLVASDLASRGLDVEEISHVINFDLPNIAETYVHRIGRTGRAEARGIAISFCEADERPYLRDIERLIGKKVPVVEDHPYPATITTPSGVPPHIAVQQRRHQPRPPRRDNGPRGSGSGGARGGYDSRPRADAPHPGGSQSGRRRSRGGGRGPG